MRLTCGVHDHSPQARYALLHHHVTRREFDDVFPVNALIDAHGDDLEYRLHSGARQ